MATHLKENPAAPGGGARGARAGLDRVGNQDHRCYTQHTDEKQARIAAYVIDAKLTVIEVAYAG